jgi:hypothetical protein
MVCFQPIQPFSGGEGLRRPQWLVKSNLGYKKSRFKSWSFRFYPGLPLSISCISLQIGGDGLGVPFK